MANRGAKINLYKVRECPECGRKDRIADCSAACLLSQLEEIETNFFLMQQQPIRAIEYHRAISTAKRRYINWSDQLKADMQSVPDLRGCAKISSHSGANAGWADARRRDAGDVVHRRGAATQQMPSRRRAPPGSRLSELQYSMSVFLMIIKPESR
jgi:hypothetical protein